MEDGGFPHPNNRDGVFGFKYGSLWSVLLQLQEETQNCGQT